MRVKLLSSVLRENLNFTFLGVMSLSVAEICTTSWSVEDGGWSVVVLGWSGVQ